MIKICGGEWKGQVIKAPRGSETRPTSAALRESIFNILINGMGHQPRFVLDLFAGTGALGLEALSHGAEGAVFVEGSPKTFQTLKANVSKLAKTKKSELLMEADLSRWLKLLKSQPMRFDVVFCDPPYQKRLIEKALRAVETESFWAEGTLFVAEMSLKEDVSHEKWEKVKEKTHGDSKVVILRRLK